MAYWLSASIWDGSCDDLRDLYGRFWFLYGFVMFFRLLRDSSRRI